MRKYATTWLFGLSIIIGEIHTFWEGKASGLLMQNWIVRAYKPMTVQWNVKYLSEQLLPIIYGVMMWFYAGNRNKINNTTVKTFIWFCLIDMELYFYNYKTYGFGPVYFWVVAIWILIFTWAKWTSFSWEHLQKIGRR